MHNYAKVIDSIVLYISLAPLISSLEPGSLPPHANSSHGRSTEGESLEDFGYMLDMMTFHGHGFELVVGVTQASTHASIKYERQYVWAIPTTNSKPCP